MDERATVTAVERGLVGILDEVDRRRSVPGEAGLDAGERPDGKPAGWPDDVAVRRLRSLRKPSERERLDDRVQFAAHGPRRPGSDHRGRGHLLAVGDDLVTPGRRDPVAQRGCGRKERVGMRRTELADVNRET